MLIIGHRGAAGLTAENTLEAMQAGYEAGADMLEFDVRVTADRIPILAHNAKLYGASIRRTALKDLEQRGPVTTLEQLLDEYYGKILLNLELKLVKDVSAVYELLTDKYVTSDKGWKNIIISSFHVRDLFKLRRLNPDIKLSMLHSLNPFAFITYQRRLRLTAVGWHRLHVNKLAIEIARKSDIFTYVYTINKPEVAGKLEKRGIDGVVTDFPDRLHEQR